MLDATVAAVWYCVNAAMVAGLWKLARRLCPADTLSQTLLHLLVLLVASIVVVSLMLRAVGWLSAWGLGAACAAIAVVSFAYTFDANDQLTGRRYPDGSRVTFVFDSVGNRTKMDVRIERKTFPLVPTWRKTSRRKGY